MPQMGESIAEGTITQWLKKIGETVKRDEPLFEISTDKVDAEIPAPISGVLLEIKVAPGKTVPISTVVAVIGAVGEAIQAAPEAIATAPVAIAPAQPIAAAPVAENSLEARRQKKSSPLVRKIAREHGVDVSQLHGSGLSGRVTKQDILTYLEKPSMPAHVPPPSSGSFDQISMSLTTDIPEAYRARVFDGDRVEELSLMRQRIAEHMVLSRRISAHVQTVWDVDFSQVAKIREARKATWQEQHGVKLTYTAFIMKAVVEALKAFPIMNSSLDKQKVIYHRNINLGLAVALDWGLLVPVLHRAEELNTLGLARRAQDLAERARTKKLKPEEVQAGTFTITNPGVFGPVFGLPVINQPQVGILGVGGVEKRPVVVVGSYGDSRGDAIAIRTKAYISLSFDHRVIDGAVADQFMARIKKGIEEFDAAEV